MKSTDLLKLLILFVLLFASCQKDDGNSGGEPQENIPDTFSEYFGNEISRDFLGTVIDKNHNPIEGVTISIGNETALTDSNGVFIIRDANVNERFGYVKAEKAGYIHASRSVVPSNGTNKVTIMMLEEMVVGTVSSGSSSTVTIDGGSSVSFEGNFVKEDGSTYDGSVNVIMHHLDPTDEDMPMQMPGMLYAENEDGAERMLRTLGMLSLELRGSSGEDLNLAEGSTSEIKVPVDASLMSIAPNTIPLWYFDEVYGYWKEEGQATLQGNMYVGTVSHFSFWNCDIPAEAITLCVTATNENAIALADLYVSITSDAYGTTYGYTNNNGQICGFVPSNESLTLNLFGSDNCNDIPLYNQTIGPFGTDSNITAIVSNNSNIIEETIVGNFLTCNGESVTDGYVLLNYNNREYSDVVNDGIFEFTFYRCTETSEFTLSGIDYSNSQSSIAMNYNFSSPLTDIGDMSACVDYGYNYIYFQVGDFEPNSWVELPNEPGTEDALVWICQYDDQNTNNRYNTGVRKDNWSQYFTLWLYNFYGSGNYVGDNGINNLSTPNSKIISLGTINYSDDITFPELVNFDGMTEVITFGGLGEVMEINFSGVVDIQFYNTSIGQFTILEEDVPINGFMHLIREN